MAEEAGGLEKPCQNKGKQEMDNRSKNDWVVKACLLVGTLLLFVGIAHGAERTTPSERALYADVAGRVLDDATGQPLSGIAVNLLYETVTTGKDGTFLFQKIPMVHTAQISTRVSTDEGIIIGCTTFDVPVRFYPLSAVNGKKVDVRVVEPGVETQYDLRLKQVDSAGIAAYCSSCHLENPCAETETFNSVVASGKDLRGIIVKESQLESFTNQLKQQGVAKESYSRIRYQDTHPDAMDMTFMQAAVGRQSGQFNIPADLPLLEIKEKETTKRIVTCDTCHTRHVPTAQKQFAILSFGEDSELCYQCHR